MPNGAGRVRPRRPLSPSVTDTQRYAVPQSTCDSASVSIRKPSPVARSAMRPKKHAMSVVAASASGAVSQCPKPSLRNSHAETYAATPTYAAWPSVGSPP